jgi:hypothetical protein
MNGAIRASSRVVSYRISSDEVTPFVNASWRAARSP